MHHLMNIKNWLCRKHMLWWNDVHELAATGVNMPSAEEKAALSNKCKTITTCLKDSPDNIFQFYLPDILTAKQLCSLSSSTSTRSRFCKKIWRFFIFLSKYLSKPIKTALPLTYLLLKYSHGRLVAFVPFASLSR